MFKNIKNIFDFVLWNILIQKLVTDCMFWIFILFYFYCFITIRGEKKRNKENNNSNGSARGESVYFIIKKINKK